MGWGTASIGFTSGFAMGWGKVILGFTSCIAMGWGTIILGFTAVLAMGWGNTSLGFIPTFAPQFRTDSKTLASVFTVKHSATILSPFTFSASFRHSSTLNS